ncbi:17248_t:CDS:2, partial [Gigaspora rosea]
PCFVSLGVLYVSLLGGLSCDLYVSPVLFLHRPCFVSLGVLYVSLLGGLSCDLYVSPVG